MNLVTGATGRIGNILVRELNTKGEKVRVLVRKTSNLEHLKGLNVEVVYGDVLDKTSLVEAFNGIETVYHLAGMINISSYNEELTINTNVQGVQNVVDACKLSGVKKLIYASSTHAFSLPEKGTYITESTPLCNHDSRGIYDRSKAIATSALLEEMKGGFPAIIVCPSGVIGPNDFEPSLFGRGIIQFVKSGLKYNFGGGYNYVDVRDLVTSIIKASQVGRLGEMYILSGERLTQEMMANYLKEFTGIKSNTLLIPSWLATPLAWIISTLDKKSITTPYSVYTLTTDPQISNEKARTELGHNPRPIKESLKDQYEWFVENKMIVNSE
jgi:dihydroflavonol-4-reductase